MYYLIHDGIRALHTGCADGVSIGTQYTLMFFDTEAEMQQYIEDNNLTIPEVENDN